MTEGESEIIECRPTKWFYLRAIAMVGMFAIFLVLFLKDWKVSWPQKNEVYYTYEAFKEAKDAFLAHKTGGGGAEQWKAFVASKKIGFPDEEGILPASLDRAAGWPEILADHDAYAQALDSEGNKAAIPPLWTSYTNQRKWSSDPPKKSYRAEKIREQLYLGIGSGVLMLVGLFFLIRTSRRSMKVDQEAYYAPAGQRVPFGSITRIDKRKWETKGLAYLYQEGPQGGRRLKVDGMVYGQFKAEDGAPAERLFQRILGNFSGELIELESDEEEQEEEPAESGEMASGAGEGRNGERE